jgi:sodium-dependent dicarboxylate transporter 2/3/5
LAIATGLAPVALVVPAAIAASCGFMMPAGTAPNAIAYSTGKLTIPIMMRRGFILNIVSVVILTAVGMWIAPAALQ